MSANKKPAGFMPWFLTLVLLIFRGILVFVYKGVSPAESLMRAIAVLVIACTCALGIATPLATTAAVGAASRAGIPLRNPAALESIGRLDVLPLDKTGTATEGRFIVALGLEHEAIAAYDAGAKSNLLPAAQLKIAVSLQGDHKRHRDALTSCVRRFGGTPVDPKASCDFGAIGSASDVLKLAQRLEEGAQIACLTNAGNLVSRELLNAAVPILGGEVRHNVVLRQALEMDVIGRLKY